MISCAAVQKLERYGYLGLKRHSTEDFVGASIKDAKRVNVYALTLLETWKEAVEAIRGDVDRRGFPVDETAGRATDESTTSLSDHRHHDTHLSHLVLQEGTPRAAPARFTDALVYAVSFAVALTTQHVLEVTATTTSSAPSALFPDDYAAALQLLTTLKEASLAIGNGRALRSNAASDDFTKAVAHLLTNVLDLVLVLLATHHNLSDKSSAKDDSALLREQMLAQSLILTASVAQMLRRVQASYPVADLYHTRPCAALLKQVANKAKQQQQQKSQRPHATPATSEAMECESENQPQQQQPLFELLHRYVRTCARASASAANLFSSFSLFQRLSMLHGALATVVRTRPGTFPASVCRASGEVQHWLGQLLSSTACNRATRYVVYFREDELRLMQHNIRQASEYALYTFTTTPPVDRGLVAPLLGNHRGEDDTSRKEYKSNSSSGSSRSDEVDAVTHARAALVLAQWCVSAPFFFESFCQDETWAAFAQEQRRLVLLQQSRARRGLEKSSKSKKDRRRESRDGEGSEEGDTGRSSSVSSRSSDDAASEAGHPSNVADAETDSLLSFQTTSRAEGGGGGVDNHSIGGSVTSLASRVSLLSTFSKHSAASYLSFLSVLRPSTAGGTAAGGTATTMAGDGAGERQLHESEDGNTNLPLILLEQLTLGLHRFMEAYPVALLDAYGLRSVAWSSIARMFAFVEASLTHTSAAATGSALSSTASANALPQPLFNLAQDIRYNKGMGYECLGLLFAKAVAPLLDVSHDAVPSPTHEQAEKEKPAAEEDVETKTKEQRQQQSVAEKDEASSRSASAGDFFANAAATTTTVGRASLTATDDAATRQHVETALSTCLTAYETVAPQVVDMNLTTILRLAARAASAAVVSANAKDGEREEEGRSSRTAAAPWSGALLEFLHDIVRRLGRNNELPHFVDAVLGRAESAKDVTHAEAAAEEELMNLKALRDALRRPRVRRALTDAAGMSLDPESLLLHLTSVAAELEEEAEERSEVARECDDGPAVRMQRALLTLEVMEAVLDGVAPTSVSASAVLEQTTQLELLLTSSFTTCVTAAQHNDDDDSGTSRSSGSIDPQQREIIAQHACTIRQCRAVTALCLQDLGSQQVHEYLLMLDETLWQLRTDIGQLLGTLTIHELQPLLEVQDSADASSSVSLLLPSLVLQRLSLARAVTAALGTTAGPPQQLHDMVAYIWNCIQGHHDPHAESPAQALRSQDYRSLLLANQMTTEDWVSVVGLGKEKHARTALMALLTRSCATPAADAAWLSCCLRCIPGAALRALVDVYVTLSIEDVCEEVLRLSSSSPAFSSTSVPESGWQDAYLLQQWSALLAALTGAYAVVGHNPYWPAVLTHTARAISHLARAWRKSSKTGSANSNPSVPCGRLAGQLLESMLCVVRSEARAGEVLRRALLAQIGDAVIAESGGDGSTTPSHVLSRSGMSVTYVESIKVPATVLSDLAAPASMTADTDSEALAETLTALKDLSFEDELRDLCTLLFHGGFVKHLFSLVDLTATTAADDVNAAPTVMCMGVLAFLYQVSLATAQTAWRARVTAGSLDALRRTVAVSFLCSVARSFHARALTAAAADEDEDEFGVADGAAAVMNRRAAALLAFLESFPPTEDQYLFAHIASLRPSDATTAAAAAAAGPAEGGALEEVETYWKCVLCHYAGAVMTLMTTTNAAATTVADVSDAFGVLFARLLTSAQHKQHQMSRSSRNSTGTGATEGRGTGKRNRRGGTASAAAEGNKQQEEHSPSSTTGSTAPNEPVDGVTAFLREVLSGSAQQRAHGSDAAATEHDAQARHLREQLSAFFGLSIREDAVGEASTICAWWLLWKLFTVVAPINSISTVEVAQTQRRVKAFLSAQDVSLAAKSDTAAVALHACAGVLDILPAAAVPPLFLDHIHGVLQRVIPDTALTAAATTRSESPRAVAAAASLLLRLLRVRPRLPAWRLLPHAQRLLVWFTHPASRQSMIPLTRSSSNSRNNRNLMDESSLCLLCIRLCGAVAAHPLVAASTHHTSSTSLEVVYMKPGPSPRRSDPVAQELLDNVWLLLLSLLHGSRSANHSSITPSTNPPNSGDAVLQESEVLAVLLLLTKTWLRSHPQLLWSRPAMLPPVLCALFTCVMRGMETSRYTPRVLNVLAGGLAAMAADVDGATAAVGDDNDDASSSDDGDNDEDGGSADVRDKGEGDVAEARKTKMSKAPSTTQRSGAAEKATAVTPATKRHKSEGSMANHAAAAPVVSARVKRMALAATTAALFEVSQHYVHVFTTYSSDMDFLFTDFLRVLSQHVLPTVTRPPIAYHAGVRIGGTTRSEMTFADLAYMCVGNAESKALLKQAALRMEEEDGGVAGALGLTDGSRSIFHVA